MTASLSTAAKSGGYANHGCIGVPGEFAALLFKEAKFGIKVLITKDRMRQTYQALDAPAEEVWWRTAGSNKESGLLSPFGLSLSKPCLPLRTQAQAQELAARRLSALGHLCAGAADN
jgi:hypothetical protein